MHIFPFTWQDGKPKRSAFIHATSQDPLLNAKPQSSWMEHLFLLVFMLGLNAKEKGVAFFSRAMWEVVVNLLSEMETQYFMNLPYGK